VRRPATQTISHAIGSLICWIRSGSTRANWGNFADLRRDCLNQCAPQVIKQIIKTPLDFTWVPKPEVIGSLLPEGVTDASDPGPLHTRIRATPEGESPPQLAKPGGSATITRLSDRGSTWQKPREESRPRTLEMPEPQYSSATPQPTEAMRRLCARRRKPPASTDGSLPATSFPDRCMRAPLFGQSIRRPY
jgi:hypothetical protein